MAGYKVEICGVNTSKLPLLTNEEKTDLFRRIQNGDTDARETYIKGNLRLVLSVIQRFSGSSENIDDLFQIGCIGLIKAIDHFDPAQPVRFSTYGVPMIIGEIRRFLRDNNALRVRRSLRDTAYRAMQVKEALIAENNREPTVEEIAKINALATSGADADRWTQTAKLTMIFLFTGMRITELFTLPLSNVHLDSAVPYIQGGIKTEAGKNRIIPLHQRILPYVQFFAAHAAGDLLVSGFCGNQKANGWRARDYKGMLEFLGIPYKVPHNTRKTMATNAAQAGVDQLALTKLMGWADLEVGNKYYIAPDVAYLAGEMDKLNGWDKKLDKS